MADAAEPTARRRALMRWAVVWLARLTVGAVFVFAAGPKLLDLRGFATDIGNYQAFPHWSVNLLAGVVPAIELLGAASILTGWKRRGGALMLGALTVGFVVLIASVIVRGIDLQCGCFGRDMEASIVGWPLLVRDLLLLGVIAIAAVDGERPRPRAARARSGV